MKKKDIINNFNEKLCLWTGGKSCIYLAETHSISNQRKGNRRKWNLTYFAKNPKVILKCVSHYKEMNQWTIH